MANDSLLHVASDTMALDRLSQDVKTMQLKCDSLTVHARLDDATVKQTSSGAERLRHAILNIKERPAISVAQAARGDGWSNDVCIPFEHPKPIESLNYELRYEKPYAVDIVGSFSRRSLTKLQEPLTMDLVILMPSSIFQPKDYLDFRYFHKRAYYLACVALGLRNDSSRQFAIRYAYQNDNVLQPVLLVTSASESKVCCTFRLLLSVGKEAPFPLNKILNTPGNARNGQEEPHGSARGALSHLYCSTLASECAVSKLSDFLWSTSTRSQAFVDACILGSIWLRQRGFSTTFSNGGFGNFEWSCVTALLLSNSQLGGLSLALRGCESYQLFKAVIQFLATSNLCQAGVVLPSNESLSWTSRIAEAGPYLFDSLHSLNLLFKMTSHSYEALRRCAINSLKCLKDPTADHFDAMFINRLDVANLRYDLYLSVPLAGHWDEHSTDDTFSNQVPQFFTKLHDMLRRGFGQRVRGIDITSQSSASWAVTERRPCPLTPAVASIGLIVNADRVDDMVEKGPPVEDEESALAFREFWHGKAELRRFSDGRILEVVIWDKHDAECGVLSQILSFLLATKMTGQVIDAWKLPCSQGLLRRAPDMCGFANHHLRSMFETCEQHLRDLVGLPLHIRQISFANPHTQYNRHKHPVPEQVACSAYSADIILQFEASGRWPDTLGAVTRAKIAFLMKIGQLLEDAHSDVTTRLGFEHEGYDPANFGFLQIIYPNKTHFRLRIFTDREESMIREALEKDPRFSLERQAAASVLASHKRDFVHASMHTQAMRTMSTRFPCFPGCVNAMKRWRDAHLLTNHIHDALIELLALHPFVHARPDEPPGTVRVAFLRTLRFIGKWDWRTKPFIIDMSGEMTSTDIAEISTNFEAWRRIDPAMKKVVMFAASNLDRQGITWTSKGPSLVTAAHLTRLARAATAVIIDREQELQMQALFQSNLDHYDFLIHLAVPEPDDHADRRVGVQGKATSVPGDDTLYFSRVQAFLSELQRLYDRDIIFFQGHAYSGLLGGIWIPKSTESQTWKVRLGFSSQPLAETSRSDTRPGVIMNKTAVLGDIARLGQGIVKAIKTRS